MKQILLICFLLIIGRVSAQEEVFSYYFHNASFRVLKDVDQFAEEKFGRYELQERSGNEARVAAGDWMVIDGSGIYLEKNKLFTMPKSEVRENSKYNVRDGWMHGVVENDSVPCHLEEGIYYFLIPYKNYLFEKGSAPHKLVMVNRSTYALFSYEDAGAYSVTVVQFTATGLDMREVEMTMTGNQSVDLVENKEEMDDNGDGLKTYILNPTKQEWNSFIFEKCLVTYDSYQKVKSE
jgi:hypothetical protein